MAVASHLSIRMPAIPTIRASVLAALVQQIDRRSGKTDILLAGHGILRSQLVDPYAFVPMARYVALFEDAAAITADQAFGARLGLLFKASDIGPIGVLFSISPTIRSAFERLSKYVNVLQGATSASLSEENGDVVWNYRVIDPTMWPRRQDAEFSLAATCQLVRSCFGRSWRPVEVQFEHPAPRDTAPLERIFRAPLAFSQPTNRIVVRKSDADRVYRSEDSGFASVLERHIADLLPDNGGFQGLRERVMALIGIYLGHKPITVHSLAVELSMSPRTLQRRLSGEGVSLRGLLREYRQDFSAMQQSENIRNAAIAHSLGYADTTVFWRARKSWEKK